MATKYLTQNLSSSGLNSDIQVGAIGLTLKLTIKEKGSVTDLSQTSVKKIVIKRPDNSILTYDATFFTDGTDGIVYYTTVAGDINTAGTYSVQGYFVFSTFTGFSTISQFVVNANL